MGDDDEDPEEKEEDGKENDEDEDEDEEDDEDSIPAKRRKLVPVEPESGDGEGDGGVKKEEGNNDDQANDAAAQGGGEEEMDDGDSNFLQWIHFTIGIFDHISVDLCDDAEYEEGSEGNAIKPHFLDYFFVIFAIIVGVGVALALNAPSNAANEIIAKSDFCSSSRLLARSTRHRYFVLCKIRKQKSCDRMM